MHDFFELLPYTLALYCANITIHPICFLFFLFVQQTLINAQDLNTLVINSPASIAGSYQMVRANWGSQNNDPITADAAFGQYGNPTSYDGCSSLTNNVTGKIVFMDRVTCALDLKCKNAQNAGAIAAIICNNVVAPEPMFKMAAGAESASLIIPCFITTKEVCDKIRVELLSELVNASILYECNTPQYKANAVWGTNPGEGDFSDGLNGWTTDKGWKANDDGFMRQGAYIGVPRFLGSETACNGTAEFNSDFLDNAGMILPSGLPDTGKGTCPAPCTGYLLSPIINFEEPLDGLTIEFTQGLRQFISEYYIMVSKDGGDTFEDTLQINQQYPANSNHITERIKVLFSGYAGVTSLRFKFEIVGNYYYWNIEDVVVYSESIVDLVLDKAWYSVSPQYKVPASQASEIPFMADLGNLGNTPASQAKLAVNISGPSSSDDFVFNLPDFEPNGNYENIIFPNTYTPPPVVGQYSVEYKVSSFGVAKGINNNTVGFDFHLTNNTFANIESNENNENFGGFYPGFIMNLPNVTYYTISNAYYIKESKSGPGDYTATKVRFGLANTLDQVDGSFIMIDLFEWDDINKDKVADANERVRVGTNIVLIDENIPNLRNIEADIWAVDEDDMPEIGSSLTLKSNTTYLLAASTSPKYDSCCVMELLVSSPRMLNNENRSIGNHVPTNFTFDALGINRVGGSFYGWENTNNSSVEDIDKRKMRQIFNGPIYKVAFLEMDIDLLSNVVDNTIPTIKVSTFPNPTSRDLYIDMSLEKVSKEVKVTLFDIKGSVLFTQVFNNVLDDRLKIDLNDVSNGVYTVSIVSEEGQVTKKVIVQK